MNPVPDADTAALPQLPQLPRIPLFAVAAPGLEALVAEELATLGITATAERGGAAWDGTLAELYTANLWLRTASRVLARVGEFRARTFPELVRHAERLPWTDFITPGRAVQLRVSCHKSRLYHEKAVAERVQAAIERVVGPLGARMAAGAEEDVAVYVPPPGLPQRTVSAETGEPEDDGVDAQLVVVRFHYDRCTISVDSSGALLHRRGYRQELARAPLRETLAAALLLASGWRGDTPLVDPFCGSGTIPIEAALIARRIAPGLANATGDRIEAEGGAATGTRSGAETASRSEIATGSETRHEDALHSRQPRPFAFQEWPGYDAGLWSELVAEARAAVRPTAGIPILGADRDAGAIAAATANAERAGVLADLQLEVQPLSELEPPAGTGSLVTNPPYGLRVGERAPLRDLYATLGKIARERLRGWQLTFLSADRNLERQVGILLEPVLETRNGGISVRMVSGVVRGEVSRDA